MDRPASSKWLAGRPGGRVRPGEVDVWRISLEASAGRLGRAEALLSRGELARANRFQRAADRAAFVTQRAALRVHLGALLGLGARDIEFAEGDDGKPRLAGSGHAPAFNASRSGDWALLAFSSGPEVGVDIERHRNLDEAALARRYFSAGENAAMAGMAGALRRTAFFDAWVRKEAYVKALGLGLRFPLDRFTVTCSPGAAARLVSVEGVEAARAWAMRALDVAPGYSAAVVRRGPPFKLRLREHARAFE
jgi:4'-phosphopantetheinyl transferase